MLRVEKYDMKRHSSLNELGHPHVVELMMAPHITRRTRRSTRREILHHGLPPVVPGGTVVLPHEAVPRPCVSADEVPAHLAVAVHVQNAL